MAIEQMVPHAHSGRDQLFMRFRKLVRRNKRIEKAFRSLRAVVHFGPWRTVAHALIRKHRPAMVEPSSGTIPDLVLGGVSGAQVVNAIKQDGYCVAGPLPSDLLRSLRDLTDSLPVGEYTHADQASQAIAALVHHESVRGILRRFFQCEPVLLECSIVVHEVFKPGVIDDQSFDFHFDFAGWQSLNLFIYLTEVTPQTGPHIVIRGTHHGKSVADSWRLRIPLAECERRYGDQIHTLIGPPGTMIFENTEAFHRRGAVGGRRVILNVIYSSHRGLFSHGRGGRSLARYLAKHRPMLRASEESITEQSA